MGKININNYEAYLLDYFEGRLEEPSVRALFAFLEKHPELKPDELPKELPSLKPPQINFSDKKILLRNDLGRFLEITDENADLAMIAWYEGGLSEAERQAVTEYLQTHPGKRKEFELHGIVRLNPPENTFFPEKASLKKPVPFSEWVVNPKTWIAAAAIVILLGIGGVLTITNTTRTPQLMSETSVREFQVEEPPRLLPENKPVQSPPKQVGVTENSVTTVPQSKTEIRNQLAGNFHQDAGMIEVLREGEQTLERAIPVISQLPVPGDLLELKQTGMVVRSQSGDTYLTAGQWLAYLAKKELMVEEDAKPGESFRAEDLISLGLQGLNRITGLDIQVTEKTDTLSNKRTFSFTSELISFTRVRTEISKVE